MWGVISVCMGKCSLQVIGVISACVGMCSLQRVGGMWHGSMYVYVYVCVFVCGVVVLYGCFCICLIV